MFINIGTLFFWWVLGGSAPCLHREPAPPAPVVAEEVHMDDIEPMMVK
jgi:hypothetical protein